MSVNPLISVIIPAYNTANTILRTLKSIEEQTYQNYEIVIINDGSPDNIKEIVENYKKNNLTKKIIIHHQKNQGVSTARNKGIILATGEFVCLLDSDDTYDKTFFEKMLKRQEETDANVVYCGFKMINKITKIKNKNINFQEGFILNCYLDNWFHISCLVINKKFLIKSNIFFDENLFFGEDLLFNFSLLSIVKVYSVKEYLMNYYYRENSACNLIKTEKHYINEILAAEKIIEIIEEKYNQPDKRYTLNLYKNFLLIKNFHYIKFLVKNSFLNLKSIKNLKEKIVEQHIIENFDKEILNMNKSSLKFFIKKVSFIKCVFLIIIYKYLKK